MRFPIALTAIVTLLVGCSSATPAAAPSTPASSTPASECELVPESLESVLFDEEYDFVVLDASAVRSPDHDSIWYVAAKATDGDNDVVGIFATTSLAKPDSVRSVNGIAKEFSSWPTDKGLSQSDTAAIAAKSCLV